MDKKAKQDKKQTQTVVNEPGGTTKKIKRKEYEQEMFKLHAELVKLQFWAQQTGARVIVIFEGRDAAGKGGVIKSITERVNPRIFRTVALPAPTEREKTQLYVQRYLAHFPAGGEIVIFDRSWYNRAGVERVMGFASEAMCKRFFKLVPLFEKFFIDAGIILVKYWFEVGMEEQTRRFKQRINDPRKLWKLSPMDLEAHRRWYDYSRARDDMFAATDSEHAPWHVVQSDNKRRARLNCISHLLSLIPYKDLPRKKVKLPARQKSEGYQPSQHPYRYIPEKF